MKGLSRFSAPTLALVAALGIAPLRAADPPPVAAPPADPLRITDQPIPMLTDKDLPEQTSPILELGPGFFAPGKLSPGWQLPTGAVWTPSLWVTGGLRSGFNYVDEGHGNLSEVVARLDLNANLQLSGTERLFVGISPTRHDAEFSNYTFNSPDGRNERSQNEFNLRVDKIFFEGDFGEIFPGLDPLDRRKLDIGFAIGRQLLEFQDGIMISDSVDSIGIVQNNIQVPSLGLKNLRVTALFGWNHLHRGPAFEESHAKLFGLFTEADTAAATLEADAAFVRDPGVDNGDGLYWGFSSTSRSGFASMTLRVNGSQAVDHESELVSNGVLVSGQYGLELGNHDVVYADAFWGIDRYSSISRNPISGGPLCITGLLFAPAGLGRYPSALSNDLDDAYGGAVGYQAFFEGGKSNIVFEAGARSSKSGPTDVAAGIRLQKKLGRRYMIELDGFAVEPSEGRRRLAARMEFVVLF